MTDGELIRQKPASERGEIFQKERKVTREIEWTETRLSQTELSRKSEIEISLSNKRSSDLSS